LGIRHGVCEKLYFDGVLLLRDGLGSFLGPPFSSNIVFPSALISTRFSYFDLNL